ncbi:MAG TPA: amidohydrolase, partial [Thermoanaerobaculia bacterium]
MFAVRHVVAAFLLVVAFAAAGQNVSRMSLHVASGLKAGEQVVTVGDDGWIRVRYSYKDNGRGPDIEERLRLAPDGTIAEYQSKGTTTFGSVVDERFTRKGSRAEWKSTSESGRATVTDSALYVPINSSFVPMSASIAALARRPDGKLPLLPGGTLTQRAVDTITITHEGESRDLQLLAQTGIGLRPALAWST